MDILKTKKSNQQRSNQLRAAIKPIAQGTNDQIYSLEFDGASKGNPGKAGAGAILKRPDGTVLCQLTKGVGIATCNFAEYQALILGLQAALDQGIHHLKAQGDSKLVCNQVMGRWQVRSDNLSTSFAEASELTKRFQSFSIQHVYRDSNSAADALANSAVLLPDDKSDSCCNVIPDQQKSTTTKTTTSRRSKKSSVQRDKGAEESSNAMKASKSIKLSHISEEDKKKFYRMDYHGASSCKHPEARVGALLYSPNGSLCFELKKGLGVSTRNVAHYQALVLGLRAALECNVSHIIIQGDALLIFKQMTGQVKVKDERLVAFWKEANSLLTRFTAFSITHVDQCNNPAACAVHSFGSDSIVDAPKTSGTPIVGSCIAGQSQNTSSKNITLNKSTGSLDPLSIAKKNIVVAAYSPQAYRPCQCFSCTLYCQTSQALRIRRVQPLPFTAVMLKSLPSYATSIHKLLLPSKRLRCIPHIFQSSLMHITGGLRKPGFSAHPFK